MWDREKEKGERNRWHFQSLHIYLIHEECGRYTGKEKVMELILEKANVEHAKEIYDLQKTSFKSLLDKYQDYDTNPGGEKLERTIERLEQPFTDFYFITLGEKHIGAVRICDFKNRCVLKQIFILPEYHGYGYAQEAIKMVESFYTEAERWELDTILQEKKLCYLYEKMGYQKTGKTEKIKDGMDLVYYAKEKTGRV